MKPSVPSIAIGLICLACSVIARADADFDFDLMHALDDALVREHVHTEPSRLPGEKIKHKIKDQNGEYEEEYEREGPGFKSKAKEKSRPGEYEYEEEMEYEDSFGKKRTVKFKRKCSKGVCEDEYQN